jgi:hypothetical protein
MGSQQPAERNRHCRLDTFVGFRMPLDVYGEIVRIAAEAHETHACIYRRLVKRGLREVRAEGDR